MNLEQLAQQLGFDLAGARAAGYSDEEITAKLQQRLSSPARPLAQPGAIPPEGPTTAGFLANAATSTGKLVGGAASAVLSPVKTAQGVYNLLTGVLDKLMPGQQGNEPYADAIIEQYAQRYGSVDKFLRSAYDDPAGVAADFSIFLGGAGAAAKGMGFAKTGAMMGEVAGAVDPLQAIGRVSKAGLTATGYPNKLYRRVLKPSTAGPRALERAAANVQTGLDYGIPISPEGAEKLSGMLDGLNDLVMERLQEGAGLGKTINPRSVAWRIEQVRPTFRQQVNPAADLAELSKVKQEYLAKHTPSPTRANLRPTPQPIPVIEAQAEKVGTYRQLRKKYGQLGNAEVEGQKALARGTKEEIYKQIPELNDLSAHEAKLLGLDVDLEKAVGRLANQGNIHKGLFTGTLAHGATGSSAAGKVAGLIRYVMTPELQSKLAITLNRYARRKGLPRASMATALSRVNEYVGQLQPQE